MNIIYVEKSIVAMDECSGFHRCWQLYSHWICCGGGRCTKLIRMFLDFWNPRVRLKVYNMQTIRMGRCKHELSV